MATLFVRCDVETGFFGTEYLVFLPGSSFFVDRKDVRVVEVPSENRSVKGEVLAYLIEDRDQETLIEMTGTPVVGGLRVLVPKTLTVAD